MRIYKNVNLSIKTTIFLVFLILLLISDGIIGYTVFSRWLTTADKTTENLASDMSNNIYQKIDSFMNIPLQINAVNQELLKNDVVNLSDDLKRDQFFVSVLKHQTNNIYSFSFGSSNGQYYGARRNENNVIEIMKENGQTNSQSWYYSVTDNMTEGNRTLNAGRFDPRTRDWYKAAAKAKVPVFSPIYKHFVKDDLTVSAAYPIYDRSGNLEGVLGTHIVLSDINNLLKNTTKENSGYSAIFEKNSGYLIANSFDMKNFVANKDGTLKRYSLADSKISPLYDAYNRYMSEKSAHFIVNSTNNIMYLSFTEYKQNSLDWIVMSAIPQKLLMSDIFMNMKTTFLFILGFAILSIMIYFLLTKKLFQPIDSLIAATDSLSKGDFTRRASIQRKDEIGKIASAFNRMADIINNQVIELEHKVQIRTSELQIVNSALEESENDLKLILDSTAEAIYGLNKDGNCTFCNLSCLKLLGYSKQDDLIGKDIHNLIHHSYSDGSPMPLSECKICQSMIEGMGTHADDEVFWRADGGKIEVEYHSYPQLKKQEVIGAVVTFMDNSERKRNNERISYLSCHDAMTGLNNRRCFEDELKKIDTNSRNLPIAIIFGDINGLKLHNDIFGHSSGDELIKTTAEVLNNVCGKENIVARVGGDEFIIIMKKTESDQITKVIEKIKSELLKQEISEIKCSISLGYDIKTDPEQSIDRIMENAENKMYKEKTLNRNMLNSEFIAMITASLHRKSKIEMENSLAVSSLCEKIGLELNISEKGIKQCKDAGFLFNIGKVVLSKAVLNGKNNLSMEDTQKIQQYPMTGYRILNLFDETLNLADAIYSQMENWDGTGYPKGLKGEEIPILARIISAAANYQILQKTFEKDETIEELMKISGTKLDPNIVNALVNIILQKSI